MGAPRPSLVTDVTSLQRPSVNDVTRRASTNGDSHDIFPRKNSDVIATKNSDFIASQESDVTKNSDVMTRQDSDVIVRRRVSLTFPSVSNDVIARQESDVTILRELTEPAQSFT